MRARIVLGTRNPDKLREIRRMLVLPGVELLDLPDITSLSSPEEDGLTLRDNALKKARGACHIAGLVAVADDTGLEVDALGGRPGLFSARLAGPRATYEDNRRALLALLRGVEMQQRGATFRCVVALAESGGWETTVEGSCRGVILERPRGESDFGYDPLFFVPSSGKTFAEMTADEKDAISHRGRAIRSMADVITTRYGLA
jgi:XTP/dITP diphosphohydrolase